jgi:hypothetical protein
VPTGKACGELPCFNRAAEYENMPHVLV